MKKLVFALFMCCVLPTQIHAQDIIVKKDGTILNVYNLEESSSSYYYTIEPSSGSAVEKIAKDDVFSIKKKDEATAEHADKINSDKNSNIIERKAVTANMNSEYVDKNQRKIIKASTPDGQVLNYAVLSEAERTLAVVKGKYHEKEYVIPEFVSIDNVIYTVIEIDNKCFYLENSVTNVRFPMTLKKIGDNAFRGCNIERIILPEGLEVLGDYAFYGNAVSRTIYEIHIPSSVKSIGKECYRNCGKDKSFRNYCQAYFSYMPDYITEGNCKSFGIDEDAVKNFRTNKK